MDSERKEVGGVRSISVMQCERPLHLLQGFLEADEVVSEIVGVRVSS